MPERRTVGLRREEGIAPPLCFLFPSYSFLLLVPGTVTLARSLPCAGSGSYRRNQFAAFSRPAGSARHTEHTPTPHSSGSQPPGPLLQLASTHLRGLRLALREPPSQFPVLTIPPLPLSSSSSGFGSYYLCNTSAPSIYPSPSSQLYIVILL